MEKLIKILNEIKAGVDWENEADLIDNHILDSLEGFPWIGKLAEIFFCKCMIQIIHLFDCIHILYLLS